MPKIDTAKIENYAVMTAEQKLAALEAFEYEPDNPDVEKLKGAVSKANSEAAEWKKKHNALLTEEQRKEAERLEAETAIKAELESLRKDKTVSESKVRFLALGYDAKLAEETAKALSDGDMEKVFGNQQIHIENVRKAERAAALAGEHNPPPGRNDSGMDKKKFDAMSSADQMKYIQDNPNWKEIITTKKE